MQPALKIFAFIFMLASCQNLQYQPGSQITFETRQLQLKSDTTINSIAFFNEKIICLQDDGKLILFDTNYQRQDSFERKLNAYNINYLFTLHDTVFISTGEKEYFIDNAFDLKDYKRTGIIYGDYLYEDSLYYVYGCCAGEWGGAVFFLNKNTKKTYSYFATCAMQVLKFKTDYVVCNNLAHLGRMMSFLFVPQPDKLYELTYEKLKNHCNWYSNVDSLKKYWEKSSVGGVRFYHGFRGQWH